MDNIKMGNFIFELRKEKNMTQKELAESLGVTDKAVSKWERGVGYPDISIIQNLSEILGINVNELLNGRYDETVDKSNTSKMNDIVLNVINYSDEVKSGNRMKRIGYFIGIVLIISDFICCIVNIALEQKFTWSLYPIGGSIVAWSVIMPIFLNRKNKIMFSTLGLFVTSIPYLFLIQYLSNAKGWVIPLALPITIISFLFIIISIYLFMKLRISKWYISSLDILIFVVFNYVLSRIIGGYTGFYQNKLLEFSIEIFVAIIFLIIGLYRNYKQNNTK